MSKEEIMRRMTAIHQVDWAFAVLLVVETFSLNVYSSLPPPMGPIGGSVLTAGLYVACVGFFLIGVLSQFFLIRFIGWFFTLYVLMTSVVHSFFPSEIIPLYSPQRLGLESLFFLISYVLVSVGVTKAYAVRVQEVSSPEDYFHSVSSFACNEDLKEHTRLWQRRLGPVVVLLPVILYALWILSIWIVGIKLT